LSETTISRCLRFFKAIDESGGLAGKWDMIKAAGNEASFRRWVENFLIFHGFIETIKEDSKMLYKKTERGRNFQSLLEDHDYVMAFRRLSGKKLRSVTDS
jgi:hypothetical protein